ncbi:DUF4604 domain-containing protein [Aphelenchoides fujianensis]|nr:DUF4604 domain-containing protein [Aphelenchoides fujianensis]
MTYKQKSSIRFVDESDPPFLRAMKEKMGYQEHKLEDKASGRRWSFSAHLLRFQFKQDESDEEAGPSGDPDDIRNMREGERPEIVVLDPGKHLTVEQVDEEVKRAAEEEDREFRLPLAARSPTGRSRFKKPPKRPTAEADGAEKPDEKKKRPDAPPAAPQSRLLSFGDDEEE